MILAEGNENAEETLELAPSTKKKSKASLLKEALLVSKNVIPKLKAESLIDLSDDMDCKADNRHENELHRWFENKIMQLKPHNPRDKKTPDKDRRSHKAGLDDIRRELEKSLSIRRRQEFEERIQFYNADNENFSDLEDKEDEEPSDQETEVLNENEQLKVEDADDEPGVDEEEEEVEEEDDHLEEGESDRIHKFMLDEIADEDNEDDEVCEISSTFEKLDEFESREIVCESRSEEYTTDVVTSIEPSLNVPDTLEQLDIDHSNRVLDLGQTQLDPKISVDSDVNMDELAMLCSGNFAKIDSDDNRDILESSTFNESVLIDTSTNIPKESSLKKNESDLLAKENFRVSQMIDITAYLNDDDVEDFERISDDEENSTNRKRPLNIIESDDDEPIISAPQKRRLKFEDSDDEEEQMKENQASQTSALPNYEVSPTLPQSSVIVPIDDDLFAADYDDDMPIENYYDEELNEDGGYEPKFLSELSGEEDNNEEESDGAKKIRDVKDAFDDEADLSGDDIGSDFDDEGDEALNEYEKEEGDLDLLPDDEEIRNGIVRVVNKQQQDDEDRQLLQIQERLFADGDLHGNGSNDRKDIDWTKFAGCDPSSIHEIDNEELEMDIELKKRQAEMLRWKMDQEKEKDLPKVDLLDDMVDSPIFEIGKKLILNKKLSAVSDSRPKNSLPRDSLLNKADSLKVLLKENTTHETRMTAAFKSK